MPKRRSARANQPSFGTERVKKAPAVDDLSAALHDEIDDFHTERDQAGLSGVKIRGLYESDESDEAQEVFGIEDDEDDSDEQNEEKGAESDSDFSGDGLDDHERVEQSLPSANAWGKKKSTFYQTDYVGDEYGGMSGSDLETAELDEKEAMRLQQRLHAQITEDDYMLPEIQSDVASKQMGESQKGQSSLVFDDHDEVGLDTKVAAMSDAEKKRFVLHESPEMPELIEAMNEKKRMISNDLAPVLGLVKLGTIQKTAAIDRLQSVMEIYANFVVNVEFYVALKCSTSIARSASVRTHPVIDRIIQWKQLCLMADPVFESYKADLDILNSELKSGGDAQSMLAVPEKKKLKKLEKTGQKTDGLDEQLYGDHLQNDFLVEEDDSEERRAVGKDIAKNRVLASGSVPKGKGKLARNNKHSRVQRRKQYDKAVYRRRSQVPDVKRETQRYGGEARGIKAGVVKSTKLK